MATGNKESGLVYNPEATLFAQAQAGCQDSLNTLLVQHERLVRLVVSRQERHGLEFDDALQAGRIGLWHAILGYDSRRGTTFSTYAYIAIMHYVWTYVQSHLCHLRRQVPLGVLVLYFEGSRPDPAWLRDQEDLKQSLDELVERLPERLRQVIIARYGLCGQEPQTLHAMGSQLGLSGEWVRQLQIQALIWLRHPAHSQELRELLARHTQRQYELADELAQVWLQRRGGRYGRRSAHT
jgi:RNA polymerase sporulation-specific sigma factor